MRRWGKQRSWLTLGALLCLAAGSVVGCGSDTTTTTDGGSGQTTTVTETVTETAPTEPASSSREPFVLRGASDQLFDKRSFSGDYKVTWSYTPNSAPFFSVDALKVANPDAFGRTVVDTEAAQGITFVNLDGDFYLNVVVGGSDYTLKFEPQ